MNFNDLPHSNAALAIFPTVSGFSFMLFDGPLSPVEWGGTSIARRKRGAEEKNVASLVTFEKLLARFRPHTVVLEAFENSTSRRCERIRALSRSLLSIAAVENIHVSVISRAQVNGCFASSGATTRYAIAKVVATYVREIRRLLPEKRKLWQSDKYAMGLFNATALLIAYYANPREPL